MQVKFVLLAAAVLSVATAAPLFAAEPEEAEGLFAKWTALYNKEYANGDYQARLAAFTDNVAFVKSHNKEYELGLQTYKVALNEFADMTIEEFSAQRNGFKYDANAVRNEVYLNGSAPSSVDWRTKGAVTPVKNQGQCGSCWAFSTTGSLEGANFLQTGKLVSFSEQELVDCDQVDQGCNGGLMDNAFKFVQANDITTESNYPYTAATGRCNTRAEKKGVGKCNGHTDVPKSDEDQLALAVAKQPVSVAIEADQSGFQLYHSGVFSGACGTQLDHGVLAVGYGTDAGQDYWWVKNSWGPSWGDQGYIKLAKGTKGPDGQCGIALSASYPQA